MQYKELLEKDQKISQLGPTGSIKDALKIMKDSFLEPLVICQENQTILGVVNATDLMTAYQEGHPLSTPINQVMTQNYIIARDTQTIDTETLDSDLIIIIKNEEGQMLTALGKQTALRHLCKKSTEMLRKEVTTKKILHTYSDPPAELEDTSFCSSVKIYHGLKKLLHINQELWDIVENSSDSIYVTDGKGITVYANDSFERMTGVPTQSILGKSVFDLEKEGVYSPSISALVLKEKRPVTLIQKSCNGKDLIVTGTPVFDLDGCIYMVICNSKDIEDLSILKSYLSQVKATSLAQKNSKHNSLPIIYTSDYMINLMSMVNKVTQLDSTILITGESGTGKGLIARYIHENSPRSKEKLIEINCSAIPESLFESELFGYDSGAFTGAKKEGKIGILEAAHKGTLFLDEIGDLPMHMQVKLLKVIQEKKITRVGSLKPIHIDARIVAATNKDLRQLIAKEQFRPDLYYRLNVFPIHMAPLRERKTDIYTLIHHYLVHYNKKHNADVVLTQKAQDKLASYDWPGNVRELEHFMERLVVMNEGIVDTPQLERESKLLFHSNPLSTNHLPSLSAALEDLEKQLIISAFEVHQNSYEVAKALDISQSSAHRKIKKYT